LFIINYSLPRALSARPEPAGTGHAPKTPKKCASFDKKHITFAKFRPLFEKKRKNLQKTSFHPQEQRFLTTPKIKNRI